MSILNNIDLRMKQSEDDSSDKNCKVDLRKPKERLSTAASENKSHHTIIDIQKDDDVSDHKDNNKQETPE